MGHKEKQFKVWTLVNLQFRMHGFNTNAHKPKSVMYSVCSLLFIMVQKLNIPPPPKKKPTKHVKKIRNE